MKENISNLNNSKLVTAIIFSLFFATGALAQSGLTLYDNANINANQNNLTNLSYLNSNGAKLHINASKTIFDNNNVSNISQLNNFFAQNKCTNDEAIREVYANGSYECASINIAQSPDNLSETLSAGASAGENSIDMNKNSINNIYSLSGAGDRVRLNSDLDMGDNKIIFGGSNISGGLNVEADLIMNGNSIREIKKLNPGGKSTNFGGDLNIGLNELVSIDKAEFSRGIEIGNSETFTGQKSEVDPSNFTVDTDSEWANEKNSSTNTTIVSSDLELDFKTNDANKVWNSSFSGYGEDVAVKDGFVYVASQSNLVKFDGDGNYVWSTGLSGNANTLRVKGSNIYVGDGSRFAKYKDEGGSVSEVWDKNTDGGVYEISYEGDEFFLATANGFAKYVDNDTTTSRSWFNSLSNTARGITVNQDNIYIASEKNALYSYQDGESSPSKTWEVSLGGTPRELAYEGGEIYAALGYGSNKLKKFNDTGSTANQIWSINPNGYPADVRVRNSEIFVSGAGSVFGGGGPFVAKYRDDGSSYTHFWTKNPYSGYPYGVDYYEDFVYTSLGDEDEVIKYESVKRFYRDGRYESNVLNASDVTSFPSFEVDSFLPTGMNATVKVRVSNSSSFGSYQQKDLELGGGVESQPIGVDAQYAKFIINLGGDSYETPEIDRVTINYGNSASAFGFNQIAIGSYASTNKEGAVAIGHNASSNERYLARFGNNKGQELDVEVTGNLSTLGNLNLGGTNSGIAIGEVGNTAVAPDNTDIVIGAGASSGSGNSGGVAIGSSASAGNGLALGSSASASGARATALGDESASSSTFSNALGYRSDASGSFSVAIGPDSDDSNGGAKASNTGSVAIGADSIADEQYTVEIGSATQPYNLKINSGNLSFSGTNNNIQGFFNQTQCDGDEAIKTIYPNGSYSCNTISSTTGKQNLSETLKTGNSAGKYNLDMSGESVTGLYGITGKDGVIRVGSDLDLGNNKLIFGGGNISGGISFNSDININGNDIKEIGFLNPSGSSTNFGGNLNVGLNEITGLDSIKFSRGIDLGEGAITGQENVQPASSFITDTTAEWTNNNDSSSNVAFTNSNLELAVTGDTLNNIQNTSLSGNGGEIVEGPDDYLYTGSGENLAKYDKSGNLIWSEPTAGAIDDLEINETSVFVATKSNGHVQEFSLSGTQLWNTSFSNPVNSLSVSKNSIYVGTGQELIKINKSGSAQWSKTLDSHSYGSSNEIEVLGVEYNDSSVYVTTGAHGTDNLDMGYLYKFDTSGTKLWNVTSGDGITGELVVKGDSIYTGSVAANYYMDSYVNKFNSSGGIEDIRAYYTASMDLTTDFATIKSIDVKDGSAVFTDTKNHANKWNPARSYSNQILRKPLNAEGQGISYSSDNIFVSTRNPDELKIFENVVTYASSGDYNSTSLDAGSIQPFSELNVESVLPASNDANITVGLSNSSDFSSSISKKLELAGGTENKLLDTNAQYVRFNITMSGDTSNTPQIDRVEIKYGNSASAYGYNQIALGKSAETSAEGAVAIGHNASSNEKYLARFGNNQGQELSAEITGNLTVDQKIFGSNSDNVTVGQDLKVEGDVYSTGADLAEVYSSHQNLESGELVMLSNVEEVERTRNSSSDPIGVVSTDPGSVLNYDQNGFEIALEGKVPVDLKQGVEVEQGDHIVPSDTSGKAESCQVSNPTDNLDSESSDQEIISAIKSLDENQDCLRRSIGVAMESGNSEVKVKLK